MAFLMQCLVLKSQMQLNVSISTLLLSDLTSTTKISDMTKMAFSYSIQLKMIKISTVSETQEVIKNDVF